MASQRRRGAEDAEADWLVAPGQNRTVRSTLLIVPSIGLTAPEGGANWAAWTNHLASRVAGSSKGPRPELRYPR
jgi:hypothetical protein